jgi:formylglycine-generating enzyme required for sulfatase activity
VSRAGPKEILLWGATDALVANLEDARFRVRALKMARVPAGEFEVRTVPGGGHDESGTAEVVSTLPLFYMAQCETTIAMYVDFLNEIGGSGLGWNGRMANPDTCGIVRRGSSPRFEYRATPGRENHPIAYVSWYAAQAFLQWCGLQLPKEAEWEKAILGGKYLDGDGTRKLMNPLPTRSYPWGNEAPDAGGVYRCNMDGAEDGFAYTAPVGSFPHDKSPYGIFDLAGNVAEWTEDWFTTGWHPDSDGYRVARGGSWTALPEGVDAVTQPTILPIKTSSIVGFRGVKRSGL